MIADVGALGYLEYRQLVNRIRQTVRQPGRAVVWLLAIAYFVGLGIVRAHAPHGTPVTHIDDPYAGAAMFAYVALTGIIGYGAASGIVGAFSCAADARFLTGSHLGERAVMTWLQLRRSASTLLRMILLVVFYALIFSGSVRFAGLGLASIAGALVTTALAVPMLKFASVAGRRTAQSFAAAIVAAGILPVAILLSSTIEPALVPWARAVERIGAADAFNALFSANSAALAAFYAFAAVLLAASFLSGTNLYPELYTASLRVIGFRDRQRRNSGVFSVRHHYEGVRPGTEKPSVFDRLGGPWTIAWKEWIGFLRSPSLRRTYVMWLLACICAGAVFGRVTATSGDPLAVSLSLAGSAANVVVIFIALNSAIGLREDLSKPLWWMGPDPLWMRLFAWIAGTSWRLATCVAALIIAWSVTIGLPVIAAAGIPLAIAAVLYLRAIGLALYALFPSSLDQRGPLAMLRALLTYLFAAPPAVAGAAIGLVLHSPGIGIAAAIFVSLVETALLIAFAALRIAGRGIAFAQAEAA